MPFEHEWEAKLAFSSGVAEETHPETIKKLLGESCAAVERNSTNGDDDGIDFIAHLRRGSRLNIDIKTREKGCSEFWGSCPLFGVAIEPELALETWSAIPVPELGERGRVGWTLDESKATDYTLHVFDPSDTPETFLIPFQLLRMTFRRHLDLWRDRYKSATQITPARRNGGNGWKSECIFVPAVIVLDGIHDEMRR